MWLLLILLTFSTGGDIGAAGLITTNHKRQFNSNNLPYQGLYGGIIPNSAGGN